jgi:hypothetical protein
LVTDEQLGQIDNLREILLSIAEALPAKKKKAKRAK